MTSVIASVVTLLVGVLAGLAPSLVVSPSKRRLQSMREEVTLISSVSDDEVREHLVRGLRATAKLHADEAETPAYQVAVARWRAALPIIGGLYFGGLAFVVGAAFTVDDDDSWFTARGMSAFGLGLLAVASVLLLLLSLNQGLAAHRQARRGRG